MRIVRSACVERHMGSLCKIVEEWIATRCIASPQSGIIFDLFDEWARYIFDHDAISLKTTSLIFRALRA